MALSVWRRASIGASISRQAVAPNRQPPNPLSIAGYPRNHLYELWEEEESRSDVDVPDHIIAYLHPTKAGSSGSPLYTYNSVHRVINLYGVHGGRAHNRREDRVGVLMTAVTNAFVDAAVSHRGPFTTFLVPILTEEGAAFEVPAHALAG